jgi:hypothetical protein
MLQKAHIYDLFFVSSAEGKTKHPQFLFVLKATHYERFVSMLHRVVGLNESLARMYLRRYVAFALPDPDLFGHRVLGYGRLGQAAFVDNEFLIRLPIMPKKALSLLTLTIHVLFDTLCLPLVEGEESNQEQQFSFFTSCKEDIHGHYLGGQISPSLYRWLLKKGRTGEGENDVSMPEVVIEAMKEAWKAGGGKISRMSVRDFRGSITHDGRFMLACPGNACDVAIYPDMVYGEDHGADISCHNLDSALQQVTLLCGIAKLSELALQEQN